MKKDNQLNKQDFLAVKRRKIIQWIILPIVIITILFGWKYPFLGFSVPLVMLMGIAEGFFRGRYVCGNLCPRGAFFDRIMYGLSPKKNIPGFFRNKYLRILLFLALMGAMIYRISLDPASVVHWGRVFWIMCVATTSLGLVLAIFLHQRSWCSFCPVGSVQNVLGGGKRQLKIDKDKCIECKRCEKACTLNLPIVRYKNTGIMSHRDCLKCSECIAVCPEQALSWPD